MRTINSKLIFSVGYLMMSAFVAIASQRTDLVPTTTMKVSADQKTDSSAFGLWFSLSGVPENSEIERAILLVGSGLSIEDSSGEFVWVDIVFGLTESGADSKSAVESKRSDTLRTYGILTGDNTKNHGIDVTELLQDVLQRGASTVCFYIHSASNAPLLRVTKLSSESRLSLTYFPIEELLSDSTGTEEKTEEK